MDDIDRQIINNLQTGFPVCDNPYQVVARQLDLSEDQLINRIQNLLDSGIISRFAPLFNAEKMGGGITLAAISVQEQFDQVAKIINQFPEVAHNYSRRHWLNMWFVIATERPEQINKVIEQIEQQTQLTVYNLPKIKEYFIELKLTI